MTAESPQAHADVPDVVDDYEDLQLPPRPARADRDVVLTGVWPVVDEALLVRPDVLIAEAMADLPRLAHQLRAELTGAPPRISIRPGREVPGSGGASWVVHALVPARRKPPRRFYGQAAG
jgi:hypothetical protein